MRVLLSHQLVAISKPRCGSTSTRLMLRRWQDPSAGDIVVDTSEQNPPFHPHITAPYLSDLLQERGVDMESMESFICIRHPINMLWSYWNFFMPDEKSAYNFSPNWDQSSRLPFEKWVNEGHVGMQKNWKIRAPDWISEKNLSPLSLEAHIEDRLGQRKVKKVFKLEELDVMVEWVSKIVGTRTNYPHLNAGSALKPPKLSSDTRAYIRSMFPSESEIYSI